MPPFSCACAGSKIYGGQTLRIQVRINCPANGWTQDHTDVYITSGPVTNAASVTWTPVATNISCPGPGPLVQDVTYVLPILTADADFAVRAVFR